MRVQSGARHLSALPPGTEKRRRRSLTEGRAHLDELDVVEQLASGISHHFNNLHMAALGSMELMAEDLPQDHPLHRVLSVAIGSLERAAALTRQLTAFSGSQLIRPKATDLNQMILQLQPELQRLAGDRIDVVFELAGDLGMAWGDHEQLETVLRELVLNGRDAIVSGRGTVTVVTANRRPAGIEDSGAAATSEDMIWLEVVDSGCGMDEATMGRIFEPFFTTRDVGKGAGMGLAAVHGLVKQIGGNIWVRSCPGSGARFSIAIPRAANSTGEARASGSQTQLAPADRPLATLLVVEDDVNLRGLIRQLLEKQKYQVLEAANGPEALAVCARTKEPIQLILTDLMMPEMSPAEFRDRLEHEHPDLPVMYMSGLGPGAAARQGIMVTSATFLQKPFTPATLLRQVSDMLGQVSALALAQSR